MGAGSARCCNVSTPEAGRQRQSSHPNGRGAASSDARRASREGQHVLEVRGFKDYKLRYKEKGSVKQNSRATLVVSSDHGAQYICRKFKMSEMPCQDMAHINRHFQNLSNLEHPHVCKFIEAFEDRTSIYLIYEKANPQTLFEYIRAKSSLTEEEAADYMRQSAMAMAVAHGQGIVHGRLSPRSIILADDEEDEECDTQLKICDLGQVFAIRPNVLAAEDSEKVLDVQRYAISPEVACDEIPKTTDAAVPRGAEKNDIWALGVIFYHMLSGRVPFKVKSRAQLVQQMSSDKIEFSDHMWEKLTATARDLIEQMMRLNPGIRISAAHILKHPWVKVAKATFPRKRMQTLLQDMHFNVEACEFKRFVMRVVAEQLPTDGKHWLTVENAYRCLDRNGDGILSVEEVIKGLKKHLHKASDDRELEDLFAQIDRDGSGTLNVQEFVCASMPQSRSTSLPVLWEAFNAFDKDRSGHVTFDEIDRIVRELEGALVSQELVTSVCRLIRHELEAVGSGGGIDFDQFVYIMKNSNPNLQDAIHKDMNRWLWNMCGIDNYQVRHLHLNKKIDLNANRRGARSAYRRHAKKEDPDEAG